MAANGIDGCADSDLDWYMNTIGETPCRTLERLRQVCNPSFQISKLSSNLPPTTCNDSNVGCCCNSIAFSLSMFCLTCQTGAGSSRIGHDAPAGTYAKYLSSCSPINQKALPNDVQSSVCSANIKLYDGFYNRVFWDDGSWFYRWSSDFLAKDDTKIKACPAPPPPPPPTSTSTTSSEVANTNTPPPTTSEEQPPPTTTAKSEESPTPTVTDLKSQQPTNSTVTSQPSQSSSSSSSSNAVEPLQASIISSGSPIDPQTDAQQQQQPSRGLSTGALAGVIVGAIVLLFIAILLAWCIWRTIKKNRPTPIRPTEGLTPFTAERNSRVPSTLTDTSGSQSQSRKGQRFYSVSPPTASSITSGSVANDTHEDAGPVVHALNRSPSGRLPPEYGRLPPAYGDGQ